MTDGTERPETPAPAGGGEQPPREERKSRRRFRPGRWRRGRGARDEKRDDKRDEKAEGQRDAKPEGRRDEKRDEKRDAKPDEKRAARPEDANEKGNARGRREPGRNAGRDKRPPGRPGRREPNVPRAPGTPREHVHPVPPRGIVVPPSPALRVLIAGGGTGGHIYPALAVADEIRRRNPESRVLFVGTRKGLEAKLVPEAGYEIEFVGLSGFAGRNIFARVAALWQFGAGVLKMRAVIRRFAPELVLGTGGYVSGPAVMAGHLAGLPTVIQEQNSVPGKMNRILARWVDEVHVAYTESRIQFRQTHKIRLSGNPVRIRQPRGGRINLHQRLGLDPARQTVLIVGGSRGARSLNRAAAELMPFFAGRRDVQFIVQTGQDDHQPVEAAAVSAGVKALVRPYLSPIEEAYAVATLAVSRAGAMTLAEIAQFGIPAILVPFPWAIYQHQLRNARVLVDKGAAELILDNELNGKLLAERIDALLADQARRREMGLMAWNLARPDAHERVVNAIEELTHPVEKKEPTDMVDEDEDHSAPGGRK